MVKDASSKKTVQKQKAKIIEDKTFGLKNKNKSKKVQGQIKSIEKNVLNSGDPKLRKLEELRKQQRVEAKARQKALKDEQEALFGEALLAVQKKGGNANQKDGKVEAVGRDGDDVNTKKSTSRAMKMMYQMDAQEMEERLKEDPNYIPTLEDEVENQRQLKVAELKKAGIIGTQITPETFEAWKEKKRQKKAEEMKKRLEIEYRKKKGGKGLSILTGRDLFEYKRELFHDDDENYDDAMVGIMDDTNNNDPNNSYEGQQQQQDSTDETIPKNHLMEEDEEKDTKQPATTTTTTNGNGHFVVGDEKSMVDQMSTIQIQSHLFLQEDDDDLDNVEDD